MFVGVFVCGHFVATHELDKTNASHHPQPNALTNADIQIRMFFGFPEPRNERLIMTLIAHPDTENQCVTLHV